MGNRNELVHISNLQVSCIVCLMHPGRESVRMHGQMGACWVIGLGSPGRRTGFWSFWPGGRGVTHLACVNVYVENSVRLAWQMEVVKLGRNILKLAKEICMWCLKKSADQCSFYCGVKGTTSSLGGQWPQNAEGVNPSAIVPVQRSLLWVVCFPPS